MLENATRSGTSDEGGVNTPDINPKTMKVGRRALKDGKQAADVGEELEKAADDRNVVNGIVVAKYDDEQPFSPSALLEAGEDWRSNAPTGFMRGIIDRVVPVPMATIDNSRYLTNAKLDPEEYPDAAEKSEFFCQEITTTVRRWSEWRSFCYSLFQETILIGYAIGACLDKYEWRPRVFRSDEGFLPDGAGQHANTVQVFAGNQDVMIHELVEKIADVEVAKDAGWKIEECCKSINKAMPLSLDTTKPREVEDLIKEGTRGASYSSGAKVIKMRTVLAVEPTTTKSEDGKYHQLVSKYTVDRESKGVLLEAEDEFEDMADCLALFTLQHGNGKFYSPKGLGKMLVNLHIAIDRSRNMAIDQLNFSGVQIVKCDAKSTPSLQMRMRHPFAIVSTDAEFVEEKIPPNIAEYVQLDQMLVSIAEQAANAYIPNKLSEEGDGSRTATEAAIDNARDQQAKVAYLARLWGQFGSLMSLIQKKLCDPETIDEDAKELQKRLSKRLTKEEIKALANCPASEVVQDMAQAENRQILIAAGELDGNPFIDQEKLLRRRVTAMTNPSVADDLILPDAIDPTVESENVRQQMMENEMFMLGASMPVSPRDNHLIHFKVLRGELERAAPVLEQNAMQNPVVLDHISAALVHGQAHIDMAVGDKPPSDVWKEAQKFIDDGDKALQKVAAALKKRQEEEARVAQEQAALAQQQEEAALQEAALQEELAMIPPVPMEGQPPVMAAPVAPPGPPILAGPPGAAAEVPPIPAAMEVGPLL